MLRRFTRGLCPRCRYPLHHDYRNPCPECGRHSGVA
jgi:predicted amidophosphoribosyltransferase